MYPAEYRTVPDIGLERIRVNAKLEDHVLTVRVAGKSLLLWVYDLLFRYGF